MKTTIFLPDRIKVGFQKRDDTYTGQLAYVIYYDQKGVLRKEASWSSWRDSSIEPQEYKNEPTSGFVLNKKVGDYVCDWNHRQAYVRVYDPRNFEFEITIENLLYVLENANSIRGKGLEGDFIYGWDNKNLILIPTESPDYKAISKYSSIVANNDFIKAKDLKIGAIYLTKDNVQKIYMGKFDCYEDCYSDGNYNTTSWRKWCNYCYEHNIKTNNYKRVQSIIGKEFFFASKDEDSFEHYSSISGKFMSEVQSECVSNYAELFDKMEHYSRYSPIDNSRDEYISYTFDEFKTKVGNDRWWIYTLSLSENGLYEKYELRRKDDGLFVGYPYKHYDEATSKNKLRTETKINTSWYGRTYEDPIPTTLEEIYSILKPVYRNKYLANGKFYRREDY